MTEPHIMPHEVDEFRRHGATLIDIRPLVDWQKERISGSLSVPLENINASNLRGCVSSEKDVILFHCQSGITTYIYINKLQEAVYPAKAVIIEGGMNTWKLMGYKTIQDRKQPISLVRQVKLSVGIITISGVLAGALLTPGFYFIPVLTGTFCLLEGLSGWCGFSQLLKIMPWNRT